jgi:hypothetical protein
MPNPRLRGIAEISTATVLTILLAISAAIVLGFGAMWAYGEMQKADSMRIQALIQGQAVLDGDVFAVQFNQPVVVEQIGYGWYDGRSGQEVGVQFRDVGSSGRYFSWRLDRADYNLTYVIVKDPNSGVEKIFRWRFVRLSPETQAAMAAQFSDIFANQYASQYAQQYANQYAQQYVAQYAQQMQQQLQNYIDQVIQQQLGSGVTIRVQPPLTTWPVQPPPTDATIPRTTEFWWSYPPPEYPTTTTRIAVDLPPFTWPDYPTTTTRIVVDSPPYTWPDYPTTTTPGSFRTCTYTIYCGVGPGGAPICPQVMPPPDCEVVVVTRSETMTQGTVITIRLSSTTITAPLPSSFVSGRTGVNPEPMPTSPAAGVGGGGGGAGGGGSGSGDSPPVDWVTVEGKPGSTVVERGDLYYGQPRNFENVPNTVAVGSDGQSTVVTKTYDNGDVENKKSGGSSGGGSSSDSSSSSGSSGGDNFAPGICTDARCSYYME